MLTHIHIVMCNETKWLLKVVSQPATAQSQHIKTKNAYLHFDHLIITDHLNILLAVIQSVSFNFDITLNYLVEIL